MKLFDENDGQGGDTLVVMDIPETEISDFEWIDEGVPYWEFLIPAPRNRYGPQHVEAEA